MADLLVVSLPKRGFHSGLGVFNFVSAANGGGFPGILLDLRFGPLYHRPRS